MDGSQAVIEAQEVQSEAERKAARIDLWLQVAALGLTLIAVVALAAFPPLHFAAQLTGLFVLALVPSQAMLIALGVRRRDFMLPAFGLLSLLAILGAYALLMRARVQDVQFADMWTFALFASAQLPQFVLLWSASRRPLQTRHLPIVLIGLVSIATLSVLAVLSVVNGLRADLSIGSSIQCGLYLLALATPLSANWLQARRDRRIPVAKGDKAPNHISGVGASAFITFAVVVVGLGLWAAWSGVTALIDGMAGLIVIVGLAAAFVVIAVGPFLPNSRMLARLMSIIRLVVSPLGWLFSWADSLLVFPVAGTLGATQSRWGRRYALLLGNLLPCGVLGWWIEAPYGLIPLGMSVLGAVAVARRWAWVEEDRENAMLNRQFDGPHIRVGFGQDLRDETLIAFAALLFLVPLMLRQLYLTVGADTFVIEPATGPNQFAAWLSFFGTELAKALPFVDWAETYHVQGNAPIKLGEEGITAGNHIIFATRILVDLVLLAAFLQAISIAQRTSKLKDMFYRDQTLDQLDPFLESAAFQRLAQKGSGGGYELVESEVASFPRYNEERLSYLSNLKSADEKVRFIASSAGSLCGWRSRRSVAGRGKTAKARSGAVR